MAVRLKGRPSNESGLDLLFFSDRVTSSSQTPEVIHDEEVTHHCDEEVTQGKQISAGQRPFFDAACIKYFLY